MEVKKKLSESGFSAAGSISKGISIIGDLILKILGLVQRVIRPIFSLGLGLSLVILAIIWLALIIAGFFSTPLIAYIGPESNFLAYGGYIGVFLLSIIPIMAIMLRITRYFRKYRVNKNFKLALLLTWVASLILVIMTVGAMVDCFKQGGELTDIKTYTPTSNTIDLVQAGTAYKNDLYHLTFGDINLGEDAIHFDHMHMNILTSEDNNIHIKKTIKSRGKNENNAVKNAQYAAHYIKYENDQLTIDPEITIHKGSKWRAQQMRIDISIPVGMKLKMDKKTKYKLRSIDFDPTIDQPKYRDWHQETWVMTDKGLVAEKWISQATLKPSNQLKGYHSIQVDGDFDLNIKQGTEWEYAIDGNAIDVSNVEKEMQSGYLFLKSGRKNTNTPLIINLTMPRLQELNIEQSNRVNISGFSQEYMKLNNNGYGDLIADITIDTLIVNLNKSNNCNLIGSGIHLSATLDNNASIDAEKYFSKVSKINLERYRNSKLRVSDTLYQYSPRDNGDRLKVYGNPIIQATKNNDNKNN